MSTVSAAQRKKKAQHLGAGTYAQKKRLKPQCKAVAANPVGTRDCGVARGAGTAGSRRRIVDDE